MKKLTSMGTVSKYYTTKIVIARHVERIGDHVTYIARYALDFKNSGYTKK